MILVEVQEKSLRIECRWRTVPFATGSTSCLDVDYYFYVYTLHGPSFRQTYNWYHHHRQVEP